MGQWGWLLLWVLVTPLGARPLSPNSTDQDTGPRRAETGQAPQPLWFNYPDDDRAKILATYRYIGEQPVFFTANPLPRLLHHILFGSILLTLLFFLYQIFSTM
ncbi:fertilization-influencing membrane protein [Malaclemys terrapin pileata]|uniref:fertilization-influencing membrane protein n=1 Tax=Malaclemys terrapin pileata TaxID=2991368 RepID=UPI0023A87E6F|nr:fertilization-influencing membrane protein [Malaclemys terrapin pileata]